MDVLNHTLKVNVKPKNLEDELSTSSDEEVALMRENILTTGTAEGKPRSRVRRTRRNRRAPNPEKWIAAWDDQLWTMWCMVRNFREDGGFQIMDKIETYADWCNLMWENTK